MKIKTDKNKVLEVGKDINPASAQKMLMRGTAEKLKEKADRQVAKTDAS